MRKIAKTKMMVREECKLSIRKAGVIISFISAVILSLLALSTNFEGRSLSIIIVTVCYSVTVVVLFFLSSTKDRQGEQTNVSDVVSLLEDRANLMPVLREQVNSVIQDTENAALRLTQSFMVIHSKAKEQFSSPQSPVDKNAESALSLAENTIEAMEEELKNLTVLSEKSVEHFKEIAEAAEDVSTKILNEISDDVRHDISEVTNVAKKHYSETKAELEEKRLRREKERALLKETLDEIQSSVEKTRQTALYISEYSKVLAEEMKAVIHSMQFQDITRQKLEHVMEPLDAFKEDILIASKCLKDGSSVEAEDRWAWLSKIYTTSEEHEILDRILNKKIGLQGE